RRDVPAEERRSDRRGFRPDRSGEEVRPDGERFRRASISAASRSGDPVNDGRTALSTASRLSTEGDLADFRRSNAALITPKERKFIERRAGNAELARAVEDEVLFSRADTKAKARDTILDVLSAPKSLKSSVDLSAAGRQG